LVKAALLGKIKDVKENDGSLRCKRPDVDRVAVKALLNGSMIVLKYPDKHL